MVRFKFVVRARAAVGRPGGKAAPPKSGRRPASYLSDWRSSLLSLPPPKVGPETGPPPPGVPIVIVGPDGAAYTSERDRGCRAIIPEWF